MQHFIAGDRVNVAGIVLAGSAEFKNELSESDMFDQRLRAAVLAVVDVSYGVRTQHSVPGCLARGQAPALTALSQLIRPLLTVAGGENGFNQAIELSADTLANVKFVQEKRLISKCATSRAAAPLQCCRWDGQP